MCGIIGYTGKENPVPFLVDGLRTLEYRGYDSAGIAVQNETITTVKAKGRLDVLAEKIGTYAGLDGKCGIGHTRWATHGEPSDTNSHPHSTENLALVHNGIIENYAQIQEMLRGIGYTFVSETDTEAAAKLIDYFYKKTKNPIKALFEAAEIIRGSYAFGVIFADIENKIFAMRKDSPLIVSIGKEGGFIASDIPAILAHSKEYYRLDENIAAVIEGESVKFYNDELEEVSQPTEKIDWDVEEAQKGGFAHFMIKEIHEEPEALRKTVEPRIADGLPHFDLEALDTDFIKKFSRIHIVACGTAMHAGLVGKTVIEKLARIPVNVEIASEFRYRDPILRPDELVILLSQSGETADTLAALRHAKANGIYTLAIVNVIGSSVAREADSVLYTWAGPEISVASTKAYSVQCALLYLIAIRLANAGGRIGDDEARDYCKKLLCDVPAAVERALGLSDSIATIAKTLTDSEHLFYIGRGMDSALGTEASLKLKEISYIHSEAYAAGELKHGTISLITSGTPVIAISTVSDICEKTVSGIREVITRGAEVILVASESLDKKHDIPADAKILVPDIDELFAAFPAATVLQLLAYHVAASKNLDVDKPRNLAKSVTVE